MAQIMCDITLDASIKDAGQFMMAKQGDSKSRLLCVHITDQKKPLPIESSATVLLNAARGDSAYAFEGRVSDGKAIFTIPDFVLETVGEVSCDVSVLGADGSRLTTSGFTVIVEASVCPDSALGDGSDGNLAAELLAEEVILTLTPVSDGTSMVISPALNRKYALDLSDSSYVVDGAWQPFVLSLPTPIEPERDHWILIYCHAPVDATAGAVSIDWGSAEERLFADGESPAITMGDFDIVCTYSPIAAKWQIGVIQYAVSG